MNEKTLGQRIRERRKQVGLSQNGLSKAAGVSGSSISLWESDHTAPRGQNLHRLAEVLQCSPTWILFGDEDKTPAPPVSLDSALDLSEDELEMLRLYRALPKSEQQAQL
ncbi:helix-turn-helix domain-containing protein, partial [Escherichia coli]